MNFWQHLRLNKSPILGLSPMDGVTDAPYRKMISQTSQPDVIITEFVNVEGLARGAIKMLQDFEYSEIERPVVAQIYGIEIESFYQVAMMACHLGFDGVDINMGCPAKKVEQRGAGAGLIQDPDHAKKIIRRVKQAVEDFSNGKTLREAGVREKVVLAIEKTLLGKKKIFPPKLLPVSVKTRMGYDEIIAEHWMEHLLEENPAAITLHGRTLKQKYSGDANWEVIAKACEVVRKYNPEIIFLGNGDIKSKDDALQKIFLAKTDGALIGRATYGNPWFFTTDIENITEQDRKKAAIEHCQTFEEIFPEKPFFIMRKHLGWYMKNFDGARELRNLLMRAESTNQVQKILQGGGE